MKIHQIADLLIRSVSSAQNGIDNRYDPEYVESLIPGLAGKAYIISYNGDKYTAASRRISGDWILPTTLTYDSTIQVANADFVRFALASPPVRINQITSGLVYVGQKDLSIQFKEMYNRGDVANAIKRGFLNDGKDIVFILKSGEFIDVFSNPMIKEVDIDIVAQNPTLFSTFNEVTDEYPISEDMIPIMERMFQESNGINLRIPPDQKLDGNPIVK